MKTQRQKLITEQVDSRLQSFSMLKDVSRPADGWVHAIRSAMRISLRQLGNRLSITPQSIKEIEDREKYGTITLEALSKVGKALNMKLVYGFVPEEGSIDEMIERQARKVATQVVMRTSMSMRLEGQENSAARIEQAIQELTDDLKKEMPRYLWD